MQKGWDTWSELESIFDASALTQPAKMGINQVLLSNGDARAGQSSEKWLFRGFYAYREKQRSRYRETEVQRVVTTRERSSLEERSRFERGRFERGRFEREFVSRHKFANLY